MGYSATLLKGDEITLPVQQTWDKIISSPTRDFGNTRWSWTQPFDYYYNDSDRCIRAEGLADFLHDYGFYTSVESTNNDWFVVLQGWQNDKLGSSWDNCWNIISSVALNDYAWVMQGEDGELWAETRNNTDRVANNVHLCLKER